MRQLSIKALLPVVFMSPNIFAQHPERDQWLLSMSRERATFEERGTWELISRSSIGRNHPVRC